MLRVLPVLAFLVWVAPANAAPTVSVQATPTLGPAPMDVTLTATGDAIAYHWDLGDKTQAEGPVVQHRYGAGRFTATVTATAADGTSAQSSVTIIAAQLTLAAPKVATYGSLMRLRGRMVPVLRGSPITLYSGDTPLGTVRADREGRFQLRARQTTPATYIASFETVPSNAVAVALRPGLDVALPDARMLGQRLVLSAKLKPRGSGALRIRIWRSGRELRTSQFADRATVRLSTGRVADYVVRITVTPNGSYLGRRKTFRSNVVLPSLAGRARPNRAHARAPAGQAALRDKRSQQLLLVRHYGRRSRLPEGERHDAYRPCDTRSLAPAPDRARAARPLPRPVPPPRGRQDAAGLVPGRRWPSPASRPRLDRRHRKHAGRPLARLQQVRGFLPSGMYYSSFFLGGFAIHGFYSVPAYPASHGCVRMPMWIAPTIFASSDYGEADYIY